MKLRWGCRKRAKGGIGTVRGAERQMESGRGGSGRVVVKGWVGKSRVGRLVSSSGVKANSPCTPTTHAMLFPV